MDNSFIRSSFYFEPPQANATREEWATWLAKDNKAAIAAKRAFNKAHSQGELPEIAESTSTVKIGGVWKQSTAIGFVGGASEGEGHLEPVVDASQDRDYDVARFEHKPRGMTKLNNGCNIRKARRARRKAKYGL